MLVASSKTISISAISPVRRLDHRFVFLLGMRRPDTGLEKDERSLPKLEINIKRKKDFLNFAIHRLSFFIALFCEK